MFFLLLSVLLPYMTNLPFIVYRVGEVTVHFILTHGKPTSYQKLVTKIRAHSPARVPFEEVQDVIESVKEDFYNWVLFNVNYTTRWGCKRHYFERTLVAQRRGLSRDGREILASQGCVMKRTLYDETLKKFMADVVNAQRSTIV